MKTKNKELTARIEALAVALSERERAKSERKPEDNPLNEHTLKDLSHGLRKGADNIPARNMAAFAETPAALALEGSRFEVAAEGREDKANKRKAQARARAKRKEEFDRIAEIEYTPKPARMEQAWLVVYWLVPIVTKIAKSKQRWANRLLGSNADDIPQMALEQIALMLARQTTFDLGVLRIAAEQLNKSERDIPGNQEVDEREPAEKKQIKKARKWLMGMVNNRVMGALAEAYKATCKSYAEESIVESVLAAINGPGDDPMTARFMADRAPSFLGTRFQSPGGINPDALAMAISGAITERGLDPLVEFLLNDENRRVDGAVEWTKHAQAIFLLTPGGKGAWMWDQVWYATKDHSRANNVRGEAAMNHVRNLFDWMPSVIASVVDSFDPHFIGWSTFGRRAILASDFELFYEAAKPGNELAEARPVLAPALRYATPTEAAVALTEHLSRLVDWKELME
jgi:hypothetical protein